MLLFHYFPIIDLKVRLNNLEFLLFRKEIEILLKFDMPSNRIRIWNKFIWWIIRFILHFYLTKAVKCFFFSLDQQESKLSISTWRFVVVKWCKDPLPICFLIHQNVEPYLELIVSSAAACLQKRFEELQFIIVMNRHPWSLI